MRILRLTTSNDVVHQGPGSRVHWIEQLGAEALGEPVEVIVKPVWPDARLGPSVEKWVAREQPDIVWMVIQSFWFEYVSVPKKLERKFGRAGKALSTAGFKSADVPWLAQNAVFRAGRRLSQRVIGGDNHFTPEEMIAAVEASVRATLRHEGATFVGWGPFSYSNYAVSKKGERLADEKRTTIIRAVRKLSDELHFAFEAPDEPYWRTHGAPEFHTDGFHFSTNWNKDAAEREIEMLQRVVAEFLPERRSESRPQS